ncbi:hypothetical protein QJS66_04645 [Kocuria rhizophila]|nr:hypothetical protein QJS66_04645 [Kocuria rhizophila]
MAGAGGAPRARDQRSLQVLQHHLGPADLHGRGPSTRRSSWRARPASSRMPRPRRPGEVLDSRHPGAAATRSPQSLRLVGGRALGVHTDVARQASGSAGSSTCAEAAGAVA